MTINDLNHLSFDDAREALARCCGATRWITGLLQRRPFADAAALHAVADEVWTTMQRADLLEAFSHHPQIGADLESLRKKFAATAAWSAGEQSEVNTADKTTLLGLIEGNRDYLAKFGHIFIVCATGKSAAEMLVLLRARLLNGPEAELNIAAAEQAKILHLRLDKLLEN
jgi:2-oxo-4-hydroxy-4-carboxy-5-ureidoimidazoline decarboxylase